MVRELFLLRVWIRYNKQINRLDYLLIQRYNPLHNFPQPFSVHDTALLLLLRPYLSPGLLTYLFPVLYQTSTLWHFAPPSTSHDQSTSVCTSYTRRAIEFVQFSIVLRWNYQSLILYPLSTGEFSFLGCQINNFKYGQWLCLNTISHNWFYNSRLAYLCYIMS